VVDLTTHTTLLARISAGADPDAWREFQDRYAELILRFAHRHGLQPADCEEVLQDVLTALSQAMPGFRYDPAKGKFRSYLKTVTAHAVYRRLSQKRPMVPLEDEEAARAAYAVEPESEQAWEAEWRQYHLRRAISKIASEFNRADLAAFDAYALGGQSAQAVAVALGLSIDQVYQAKSRILRRLTELIAEQVSEEG
jgi:RNA polymerase sigma-70 factor (ECF subfamily)